MALSFPSNPQSGDNYSAPNGVLYTYDGVKWVAQTTTTTGTMVVDYVQDSIAPIFTNIVSDNISFSYDETTNVLSATISSLNAVTNQLVNGSYDVTLDVSGNTTFPSQTYIRQNNSYTRTFNGANISGAPTVIWTGTNDNITSVKMTIQIEGYEAGDTTGWHTQTCEAVIAERYWSNAGTLDPTMSVYGVVHTSVDPLATFTVQRNPTTHFIEVVATPTGTAFGTLTPKVHSVELGTRD